MEKINSKHLFFIITGLGIVSMKTYPTVLTNTSGNDTWIAIIISSALFLLLFTYFLSICKKYDCFNLVTIYKSSLGKTLGSICIFLIIFSLILTLIECCSLEVSTLHTSFLLETPNWYLLLFFILPCLYTVRKNPTAIIITTIITTVFIMISGITLSILTAKYKHFKYLFPVLVNGFDLNLLLSIIKSMGLYGIILFSIPYMEDVENKDKIVKHSFLSMLFIIQIEIMSIMGVISTFGVERANSLSYPKILQSQLVNYFGFIESGEFYIMIKIVGGWFIKYVLVFYCMIKILKEFNILSNKFIYIITAIVYTLSLAADYNLIMLFKLLDYYTYICFANFIVIPFITFTIFLFKKKLHENL